MVALAGASHASLQGIFPLASTISLLWTGFGAAAWILATEERTPEITLPDLAGIPTARLVGIGMVPVSAAHLLLPWQGTLYEDEVAYVMQSRMLTTASWGFPLSSEVFPLFSFSGTFFRDGIFYTQYPPGWPAILSMFDLGGLLWIAGPSMALCTLLLTHRLGVQLSNGDRGLAAVAVCLLMVNPTFVRYGGGFFAHAATSTCVLAGALFLLASKGLHGRWATAGALLSGLFLGVAISIRPATGIAMACSVFILWLIHQRPSPKNCVKATILIAIGALGPLMGVLFFNARTTGAPFAFGYDLAHQGLHNLGFGERGYLLPDINGEPIAFVEHFTPSQSASRLLRRIASEAVVMPAVFGTIPLVILGVYFGMRARWRYLLVLVPLPLMYGVYFVSEPRFYFELIPFVAIMVAWMWRAVHNHSPIHARVIVLLAVGGGLVASAAEVGRWMPRTSLLQEYRTVIDELRKTDTPMVVLVSDRWEDGLPFPALSWHNSMNIPGPFLVARDLDGAPEVLRASFPSHAMVRVRRSPVFPFELEATPVDPLVR